MKRALLLSALLLAGCGEDKAHPYLLSDVHAVGCDASSVTFINRSGQIIAIAWARDRVVPHCRTWNEFTWWSVDLTSVNDIKTRFGGAKGHN